MRDRLRKFNGIEAEVLYPPLLSPNQFYSSQYGEFLLYFGRLIRHKRQWLGIESLRLTRSAVKLVIAGRPDPGADFYLMELEGLVKKYGLGDRVTIFSHWVPEDKKAELFADCLGVVYFPFDEDSYGYPSLEAHAAHKCVLTTTDAGGTNELIKHGINGFVTPPDSELIADAMDELYNDRTTARKMGEEGARRVADLGISWDNVISRLLS